MASLPAQQIELIPYQPTFEGTFADYSISTSGGAVTITEMPNFNAGATAGLWSTINPIEIAGGFAALITSGNRPSPWMTMQDIYGQWHIINKELFEQDFN